MKETESKSNKSGHFIDPRILKQVHSMYVLRIWFNLKNGVRWILLAAIVGVVVGAFSSSFAYLLGVMKETREANPWLLYLLPFGGLVIVFLYGVGHMKKDKGTNILMSAVHDENIDVPPMLAPVIYISTLITHLLGGSAGREGAALQMGGSLGNTIGRLFKLSEGDRKILVMSGMSAAFSAVFGTPLAAAIFPMEMISVGIMQYSALVPCIFSSLVANRFATRVGLLPENYDILDMPYLNLASSGKMILLGTLCAGLSVIFVMCLKTAARLYEKYFPNPYLKVFVGGCLVILLTVLTGTTIYNGAGTDIITMAIEGEAIPWAFALKIIFTAVTLAAGYKGGEIVPAFFVGSTFGCVFGTIMGISPSLCAAAGMLALFCGVTNCPITSMLIGFELFGFSGVKFLLIAISISFMLSGYSGLYREQIIVYSKYHPKYINRFSGDEDFTASDYEE